jgi:glutathionyl-hydroquinone reductase
MSTQPKTLPPASNFRNFIASDGPFKAEEGRYIIYANYSCPFVRDLNAYWTLDLILTNRFVGVQANRVLLTRNLKRLEGAIGMRFATLGLGLAHSFSGCAYTSDVSYLDARMGEVDGLRYSGINGSDEMDPVYGCMLLQEIYRKTDPNYSGRCE